MTKTREEGQAAINALRERMIQDTLDRLPDLEMLEDGVVSGRENAALLVAGDEKTLAKAQSMNFSLALSGTPAYQAFSFVVHNEIFEEALARAKAGAPIGAKQPAEV